MSINAFLMAEMKKMKENQERLNDVNCSPIHISGNVGTQNSKLKIIKQN
jgi:hypothetical protein